MMGKISMNITFRIESKQVRKLEHRKGIRKISQSPPFDTMIIESRASYCPIRVLNKIFK